MWRVNHPNVFDDGGRAPGRIGACSGRAPEVRGRDPSGPLGGEVEFRRSPVMLGSSSRPSVTARESMTVGAPHSPSQWSPALASIDPSETVPSRLPSRRPPSKEASPAAPSCSSPSKPIRPHAAVATTRKTTFQGRNRISHSIACSRDVPNLHSFCTLRAPPNDDRTGP